MQHLHSGFAIRCTVDFLTKTKNVNKGEVPQYYVECSHPPIIDPAEWQAVNPFIENLPSVNLLHNTENAMITDGTNLYLLQPA